MHRRKKFTALWASALMMGLLIGGASSVPQVLAKSPSSSMEEPQLEEKPGQSKASPTEKNKPAAVRCKLTKDCQKGQVCQKVGDHKECISIAVEETVKPPVT